MSIVSRRSATTEQHHPLVLRRNMAYYGRLQALHNCCRGNGGDGDRDRDRDGVSDVVSCDGRAYDGDGDGDMVIWGWGWGWGYYGDGDGDMVMMTMAK